MIDAPARRTDRRACPYCEATPTGCESLHVLAGRWCCQQCTDARLHTDDRTNR